VVVAASLIAYLGGRCGPIATLATATNVGAAPPRAGGIGGVDLAVKHAYFTSPWLLPGG
jgi:hypothetical protein